MGIQTAQAQHRAVGGALAGVVVHHVEDHLDTRRVQRGNHGAELGDLGARRAGVTGMRGEVARGRVAPVVTHPACVQGGFVAEGMHRKQLNGGDAEVEKVPHRRGMGQPEERTAQSRGYRGMGCGEGSDVQFVEDCLPPGHCGGGSGGRSGGDCEHGEAVADLPGVGVQQQYPRIAIEPAGGVVGTVYAVAVALPGCDPLDDAVPDPVGPLGQFYLSFPVGVQQAQLHPFGDGGRDRKTGPGTGEVRAEGKRGSGLR